MDSGSALNELMQDRERGYVVCGTWKGRHAHSWLTLQLPSELTVATGRQGVPQLFVPGSFGFPFPSSARFHISPLWELCSNEPIKLCRHVKRQGHTYVLGVSLPGTYRLSMYHCG